MLSLLNEEFAPTTSTIGFLEAPIQSAADELLRWRGDLYGTVGTTSVRGGLRGALANLEPLTLTVRPRELLVQTSNPAWTAYFDCGALGTDAVGPVHVLSGRLGGRGVVTTCVPHTMSRTRSGGRYGAVMFEVVAPDSNAPGHSHGVRTVAAANDGGRWVFYAYGEPQPFEEPEAYGARIKRDRFTSHMLDRYCRALGLRIFDEDFYSGPSILFEAAVPYRGSDGGKREFTFAQNRDRWGVVPGEADALRG